MVSPAFMGMSQAVIVFGSTSNDFFVIRLSEKI